MCAVPVVSAGAVAAAGGATIVVAGGVYVYSRSKQNKKQTVSGDGEVGEGAGDYAGKRVTEEKAQGLRNKQKRKSQQRLPPKKKK